MKVRHTPSSAIVASGFSFPISSSSISFQWFEKVKSRNRLNSFGYEWKRKPCPRCASTANFLPRDDHVRAADRVVQPAPGHVLDHVGVDPWDFLSDIRQFHHRDLNRVCLA